ncbi:MAG: hypothetical protein KatS3mg059_1809 [Thermomicrobiales bacterium]|nr:MAG: hypothetical protein KatS3mg059_1809 [Thermomicrobiales bacterium]
MSHREGNDLVLGHPGEPLCELDVVSHSYLPRIACSTFFVDKSDHAAVSISSRMRGKS